MKQHISLVIALFFSVGLFAQSDAERMAKDIEIAENILIKLTQQQLQNDNWYGDVEGKYIEGYGVVFTVHTSLEVYAFGLGKDEIQIRGGNGRGFAVKNGTRNRGFAVLGDDDVAEEQLDREEIIQNTATQFLTNYAFLLHQLEPSDKVLLNFVDDWEEAAIINPFPGNRKSKQRTATLTAEVEYQHVKAFKSRQIDEAAFLEKVRFSEADDEHKEDSDIEMLITILNRLYDEDMSETFVIYDAGHYTTITGLGVIVELEVNHAEEDDNYNTRSSARDSWNFNYGSNNNDCRCPDDDKKRSRADSLFSVNFKPFLQSFKENLVEYGQTVQSLNENEILIFRLHFDDGSDDGKLVDVSVSQEVLNEYAAQSINFKSAVAKVKVVEKKAGR